MKSVRLFAAVATAVFGVLGSSSVPASAVDLPGLSDLIAFSGCTTSLTPPVASAGGSGSYSFSAPNPCTGATAAIPTFCIGLSDPGEGSPVPVEIPSLNNCDITPASGSYINIVCGTGITGVTTAPSVFGDTATVNEHGDGSATIHYSIVFVAGVGVIVGTATETDSPSILAAAAGVVDILPDKGTCVAPVSAFRATGVAGLVEINTGD